MTEKRINLCFNVDDKRQEIVYDFLMERGKKKTATVIDLVMAYLSGQSEKKSRPEYWSGYCRTGRTRYQRELEPDRDGKNPKKSRQNPHPSGIRCHHKLESGR